MTGCPATPPPAGISIRVTSSARLARRRRARAARRQALADLVERGRRARAAGASARRQPHRETALGHRVERVGRAAATRAPRPRRLRAIALRAGRQLGREEPGVEPARHRRRRHPARERDEQSVRSVQVELCGQRLERRSRRRPGPPAPRGAVAVETAPVSASSTPASSKSLADRGDVRGDRLGRAAGRRRAPLRPPAGESTDRATSARVRVGRVDPAAREHVDVGRERHRRRPAAQQHLEPVGPGRSRTTVAAGAARRPVDRWQRRTGSPADADAISASSARPSCSRSASDVGHRQAAHEAAADVRGRPAVDRDPVGEQRDDARGRIARSPPRPGSGGSRASTSASRPASPDRAGSPTIATSTTGASARSIADSHCANPVG